MSCASKLGCRPIVVTVPSSYLVSRCKAGSSSGTGDISAWPCHTSSSACDTHDRRQRAACQPRLRGKHRRARVNRTKPVTWAHGRPYPLRIQGKPVRSFRNGRTQAAFYRISPARRLAPESDPFASSKAMDGLVQLAFRAWQRTQGGG